jgi:hypothetical protein
MSVHTPWFVAPDRKDLVFVPGVAQPMRCGSAERARLIAAAPKALVLARYAVDNPDFDSAVFDHMAREFIAEATGEQP